jgi:hypothetical protein
MPPLLMCFTMIDETRKAQSGPFDAPDLLYLPVHKATADEARRFVKWLNSHAGDRRSKWLGDAIELVFEQALTARRNRQVSVSGRLRLWLEPHLPEGWALHLRPALIARKGEPSLTFVGKDLDTRCYIALVSLSDAGLLAQVRRCAMCKRWFVATHKDKDKYRFCTTLCRVKWHAHTPEGRRKHAEYVRKNRADRSKMANTPVRITKEMLKKGRAMQ